MDWIELDDFRINCIIGVLEREQREPQNIELEIRLGLDLRPAAGGDLSRSVNYADVADQSEFLAKFGRWRLLESLGAAICRLVLSEPAPQESRASVEQVQVLMRKPEILGDQATPAVRLQRSRAQHQSSSVSLGEGVDAEILAHTDRRGAYRVHIAGGRSWSLPPGVAGLLIAGSASVQGQNRGEGGLSPGEIISESEAGDVVVANTGAEPMTLLAVGPSLGLD